MKIFLGYPSEHPEVAQQVLGFVTSLGHEVWFDKKSIVAGTEWDRERQEGQQQAQLVIHIYSEEISKRPGVVHREIKQSLRLVDDQPLGSLYIVTIRLDRVRLPVELTRFHYVDFVDGWKGRLAEALAKRQAQLVGSVVTGTKQSVTEEKAASGSRKIEFEELTPAYECRGEYLQYTDEGAYWTYVNGAIASHALGDYFRMLNQLKRLYGPPTDDRKHEWSITIEEFFRSGDLLSIRFYSYVGIASAAHPNHYIRTINFFGRDAGSMRIEELLGQSREQAMKIINYCEGVVAATLRDEVGEVSFFDECKTNEEDTWRALQHYGFDKKGLTFNFSPYAVLPYALGSHEVLVPWRLISIPDQYQDIVKKLT